MLDFTDGPRTGPNNTARGITGGTTTATPVSAPVILPAISPAVPPGSRRTRLALQARNTPPSPAAWQTGLQIGDVVAFRFPVAEEGDEAGPQPKVRPCLVIEITERGGHRFATLAYGTGAGTRANRGYEIRVMQPEALAAAHLDKPTRFVAARRLTVSLENPGFHCHARHRSPVIGRLGPAELERLHAVRGRIQAEADIAAHYRMVERAERCATSQPTMVLSRPVVAENRPAPNTHDRAPR